MWMTNRVQASPVTTFAFWKWIFPPSFTLPAAYIHIWFSAWGEDTSDFHPNKVPPCWAAAEVSDFTATERSAIWDKDYGRSEGP